MFKTSNQKVSLLENMNNESPRLEETNEYTEDKTIDY